MRRMHRWAVGVFLGCLGSFMLGSAGGDTAAREADTVPQAVIDDVVKTVCGKEIVLLGELPTHGEALAFDAKSRIVEALIERCGFTTVLFEAGIYDFAGFDRAVKARAASIDLLNDAIGRFWWTRELAPWRRALFDRAVSGRLTIGGLDDQVSITSHYAQKALPSLIEAASVATEAAACRDAVTRNLGYTYDTAHPFDDVEKLRLRQCARNAATAAPTRLSDASDRAMLDNFARYADRQTEASATAATAVTPATTTAPAMSRDESMFRNLAWYLDQLPAHTRVVVWTATVHAAKQRGSLAEAPLGARAVERWADRVASIGFSAFAGETSRAGRPATPIADAPAESLEASTTHYGSFALLNSGRLRSIGRVSSRLLGRFTSETWSEYFDLVLIVRREAAPTFDPWK